MERNQPINKQNHKSFNLRICSSPHRKVSLLQSTHTTSWKIFRNK
jgi:hypothetical protein